MKTRTLSPAFTFEKPGKEHTSVLPAFGIGQMPVISAFGTGHTSIIPTFSTGHTSVIHHSAQGTHL